MQAAIGKNAVTMEAAAGLEPATREIKTRCSTSCATPLLAGRPLKLAGFRQPLPAKWDRTGQGKPAACPLRMPVAWGWPDGWGCGAEFMVKSRDTRIHTPKSQSVTRAGVCPYVSDVRRFASRRKRGEPSCRFHAPYTACPAADASVRDAFSAPSVSSSISHCRPRGIAPRRNHCQTVPRPTPRARAASLWPPKCCVRSLGVITSTTVDNAPAWRQPL